ncbi:MAG TPA: efflux RND transporter periplasmic adaptor subunit [Verrucomicrobiae bacterium]|nr:efflux RND transporter periplasmic adaptor subunit [Verrucomicrobiae bacterium]
MSIETPTPANTGCPPVAPKSPPEPPKTVEPTPTGGSPSSSGPARGRFQLTRRGWWVLLSLAILAAISFPILRALSRTTPAAVTAEATAAPPSVAVTRVTREDLYLEDPIPAEFRPYVEDELHAKVSGYVQDMLVDFGDHVKAGQLLATLDVPELHDELDRALSAQRKAEADYTDAHIIYTRLLGVQKQNPALIPQQDIDTAAAKDHMTEAAIAEAKAEVERYQTLVGYTRITAPFDGVITKRYVDPGALVQAGTASDTQSLPVVRVSDNYLLRLDFPVSVEYVREVHDGEPVQVRVESLGGKEFTGKITRSTQRVNDDTRTMIAEIEVANPKLELVPGMYAKVLFKYEQRPQAVAIPIEAVPPGQTSTVYVVNSQDQIEERSVTLGLQTPTKYEVVAGLKPGEQVLIAGRSTVQVGEKVEPKLFQSLAEE